MCQSPFNQGMGGILFGFSRTGNWPLSQREEWVFLALQPHLANCCSMLRKLESLSSQSIHAAELARDNRLLISPRTVERHVEHIYSKPGVRTRRELLRLLLAERR